MRWISLKGRPVIFIYSCLFIIETVSSEGVHVNHGHPTDDARHTSDDTRSLASISSPLRDVCTESWCTFFSNNELLALDAIRSLHRQIDDDQNGNIDFDESDEFLREELKYEGDYEKRQKKFHQNDDNHISVRELWDGWVRSDVYNWTVEQTLEWLSLFVGLPQYTQNFIDNSVNGSFLPRLAINHHQVLSTVVGIKDLIHKQKIALKAQDVVLFGSPKDYGNRTKDTLLTTLLALALLVCWFVFSRYKLSQRDLNNIMKDMESLAKAEQALIDLQKELEKARTEQQEKAEEEAGFQQKKKLLDDEMIPCSEEITRLKGEVEVLRNELQRAEVELQDKCWVPPAALQHWLQLTYELELKSYNRKKQAAEKQLKQAKDACDKLKKKRSSLMGAFVSTHGRSIDDVDKAILEARTALTEITHELQERMHRWKQIESLLNCPIMNNPGLPYLEAILRGIGRGGYNGPGSVISNSQDDIDDDAASSIYCPSAVSKLIANSTFMMYPAHETFRFLPSVSEEIAVQTGNVCKTPQLNPLPTPSNSTAQSKTASTVEPQQIQSQSDCSVSAPASGSAIHVPIMRSKSVSSMISLRSRECSSKESSTGEEEVSTETSEMTSGRDRRVTFGIRTDHRELISTVSESCVQWKKEKNEKREEEPKIAVLPPPPVPLIEINGDDEDKLCNNNNKKKKQNIKIWRKLLSSATRSGCKKNSDIDNKKLLLEEQTLTPIPDNVINNSNNNHSKNKMAIVSWSRRHFLDSWKVSHAK